MGCKDNTNVSPHRKLAFVFYPSINQIIRQKNEQILQIPYNVNARILQILA